MLCGNHTAISPIIFLRGAILLTVLARVVGQIPACPPQAALVLSGYEVNGRPHGISETMVGLGLVGFSLPGHSWADGEGISCFGYDFTRENTGTTLVTRIAKESTASLRCIIHCAERERVQPALNEDALIHTNLHRDGTDICTILHHI